MDLNRRIKPYRLESVKRIVPCKQARLKRMAGLQRWRSGC